ncbi:MAG: nucleotidyltransferase domain-containing protein [Methanospirillum sp.]
MDALAREAPVPQEVLDPVVARIRSAGRPSRIILFGSRARGDADREADPDLLVVEPVLGDRDRGERMVRYRTAIGRIGLGVDLLVSSEEK